MPARIALLYQFHVTAESGRAAIADGLEGFLLMSPEYMTPPGEEILFVRAENIGHFKPMLSHRREELVFVF